MNNILNVNRLKQTLTFGFLDFTSLSILFLLWKLKVMGDFGKRAEYIILDRQTEILYILYRLVVITLNITNYNLQLLQYFNDFDRNVMSWNIKQIEK